MPTIFGTPGADALTGTSDADYIDGQGDADSMQGLGGDDTYVVDNSGDIIIEVTGEGRDRLYALTGYVLAGGVSIEELFTGGPDAFAAIDITGNEVTQQLFGNSGANVLDGGGGNDLLFGYAGVDSLFGGAGDDHLDGGAGDDSLAGGTGDDRYFVDSAGDTITEGAGAGSDLAYTSVDYVLAGGAEVEVLVALGPGSSAIDITGNEFGQHLYGNDGINVLDGGGGNDILFGSGGGVDTLIGGDGNDILSGNFGDTLAGGTGNDVYAVGTLGAVVTELSGEGIDVIHCNFYYYTLTAGAEIEAMFAIDGPFAQDMTGNELAQQMFGNTSVNALDGAGGNDILYGYQGIDTLTGGADDDYLNGGEGDDAMAGGSGNDVFVVDSAGDTTVENVGEGADLLYALIDYTLAAGQEVEVLAAGGPDPNAGIDLTGNELNNQLWGNAGANVLDGKGGFNIFVGFGGADTFLFTSALGSGNLGAMVDFASGTDVIALDDAIFGTLSPGSLAAGSFVTGTAAQDADDRIIYDQTTGSLLYDADGNGGGEAIGFGVVVNLSPVAAADFLVV